jgi:hypothetical protein
MDYYRVTIPIPRRPWLWVRFRIGTILLLVAIAAILLSWRRDHRELTEQIQKMQSPSYGYGANQVIGAPNTTGPGDISTAWASAAQDDQAEWLILEYDTKVVPKAIIVHETYNPGAVVKATHYPKWGKEEILWEGTDPTPVTAGAGVSRLPVQIAQKTGRIKLYIDSQTVAGWNEIDAVGLELDDGKIIWATGASSSSNYGSNHYAGPGMYVY